MIVTKENEKKVERAVLVAIRYEKQTEENVQTYLDELELLVKNLEIDVIGKIICKLREPNAKFLLGEGKAQEIKEFCEQNKADCLIFDDIISPSQQRNWEKMLEKICVIDRQEVILDIFSGRAQTREAKLQISLARAKYNMPRLNRAWTHLSRQRGGGLASKGEGEQQIELDRRMVKDRIQKLEKELDVVRKQRNVQRKQRQKKPVPNAAIVGYTNAGKSSFLNHLTGADIYAADKLFATLDPTTKPVVLPNKQTLLLTDTVGFVRKLPHQLIESFKATLEEAVIADFLVHVIDVTSPDWLENYKTTLDVLHEIGIDTKTMLIVFNKIDKMKERSKMLEIKRKFPDAIFISAKTGENVQDLEQRMAELLDEKLMRIELKIPISRGDIIALIHSTSDIISESYEYDYVSVTANIERKIRKSLEEFIIN